MDAFWITLKHGYKTIKLLIKPGLKTDAAEQFEVIARNKTIVVESNRPKLRKLGLKYWQPEWKLVSGNIQYHSGLVDIGKAIMKVIEPK